MRAVSIKTGVRTPKLAQGADDLNTVASGQHHVENDRIVRVVGTHDFGRRAVRRRVDDVAAFFEGAEQDVAERRIVLNDQEFQRSFSRHVSRGNYTYGGSGPAQ